MQPAETDQAKRMDWIRKSLHVAAVCDILDDLGYRRQAMHQRLRPLDPDQSLIVGRARTFRWMETDYVVEDDPYGLEIDAMDSLKPGDVVVHSTDPGGNQRPLGRADEHPGQAPRGRRLRLRQPDPRLPADHRHEVPGLPRRDPARRQQRARPRDGLRRPGAVRRRARQSRRTRLRRLRRRRRHPAPIEDEVIRLAADKIGKENDSRRELLNGRSLRDVYDEFGVL